MLPRGTDRALGTRRRAAHPFDVEPRHDVRIHVRVRAAVLDVALAILSDLPGDPHRRAAIGHAVAELLVRAGLVETGEALLDTEAVVRDVEVVPRSERLGRRDTRVVV